jgi:hypothetical protein
MIRFLKSLISRYFESGQLIYREHQQCNEIVFVEKGIFNVGYEINNI